ncbi:beta-glucosidase-like glycosyl hydrolase [Larkinella arboricola]|uniref:beta-N-acetylhexosaminidase n=1 Tax=Larkinella arboricola TaxID=643671 RepID=A0A327X713_LARAB|nr:glycoside hydrolase family 3 N-terminal domain-containing protein [Larkinella arboricola]RAK02777.1 beta-glucosidase-like glycosyl hydrolase [Larkinella arboricola]
MRFSVCLRSLACAFSLFVSFHTAHSQTVPSFLKANPRWVDSVFNAMTPDQRISQLIMVAGFSNRSRGYEDSLMRLVQTYQVGGIVFFQGGPIRQARLINRLQTVTKVPMLVAIDGEWGLGMRLDSTVRFPYQMTMGAIQERDDLIYKMGAAVARQSRRLGIHINFAPVADVNNNPNNPVINFRSFGEDKEAVARKALAYMKGMQDNGLLTSLKHFPGHGDTGTDSHYDLPLISKNRQQLEGLELYPFRKLIDAGAAGVMIAHLNIPALDATPNLPSTLSRKVVSDLLKNELGFGGLVYSDAMNMKGVTKYYPSGIADRMGLEAGMDVLEYTLDIPRAIAEVKQAIADGRLSQADIDARCRKVLAAKAWAGLDRYKPVDLMNLVRDLNEPESELLNRLLTEEALTVLKNDKEESGEPLIPLLNLGTKKIASVSLDAAQETYFQKMLGNYTAVKHFNIAAATADTTLKRIRQELKDYDLLLVGVHLSNIRPAVQYGVTPKTVAMLKELCETGKAVVSVFGNPYALAKLEGLDQARGVIMAYQLTQFTEELAAQLIFGAIPAKGKLPVTVNERYKRNDGIATSSIGRLKYTIPEEVGVDSYFLTAKIDSLMQVALTQKATPGGVVQMAKDGKVIFRKAYGTHTYEGLTPTKEDDLFDLASVTKVSTSTLALMRLVDEGKFNLDATMADYLPDFKESNKANLIWRDVLTHQAGLKASIAFWTDTKNPDGTWKDKTFDEEKHGPYKIEITDNLFMHRRYRKTIFETIRDSPVSAKKDYVYSDLSFILYPKIVEKMTDQKFEDYLKQNVYEPLGATTLTFNPMRFYPLPRMVPTEYDSVFRKTLVWGRVHDEGAAMLGGVSGHAGLFGSSNDLMKLVQMYLQKGYYGGKQFISPQTVTEFTRYQFPEKGNRRGIGFDKPTYKYTGNAPRYASPQSFGHSGFTGTFIWVDPQYNTSYVFMSNRVYPSRTHTKLITLNIRTNVADVLYEAIRRGPSSNLAGILATP